MNSEIERRLAALQSVAQDLNSASDAVTATLRAVEERLVALNLGVAVRLRSPLDREVEFDEQGNDLWTADQCFLAFERWAGRWRIVVHVAECEWRGVDSEEELSPGGDDEESRRFITSKPLLDCIRQVRIDALYQLDELFAEIETQARKRIESIHDAIESVNALVGTADSVDKTPKTDATAPVSGAEEGAKPQRRQRSRRNTPAS